MWLNSSFNLWTEFGNLELQWNVLMFRKHSSDLHIYKLTWNVPNVCLAKMWQSVIYGLKMEFREIYYPKFFCTYTSFYYIWFDMLWDELFTLVSNYKI